MSIASEPFTFSRSRWVFWNAGGLGYTPVYRNHHIRACGASGRGGAWHESSRVLKAAGCGRQSLRQKWKSLGALDSLWQGLARAVYNSQHLIELTNNTNHTMTLVYVPEITVKTLATRIFIYFRQGIARLKAGIKGYTLMYRTRHLTKF